MPTVRPPVGASRLLVLWLGAAIALCALSLAIQRAPNRYVAEAGVGEDLAPVAMLQRWHPSREGASLRDDDPPVLRLEARSDRLVYGFFNLAGVARFEHLRVSAELRGEGLARSFMQGGPGQLVALSLDRRYRRVPHWPIRVAALEGSSEWRRESFVIPTAERVHGLQVVAFVGAAEGWMEMRRPRVEAVREQPVFTLARYLVLAGWAALAALLLWRLLRPGPRRLPRAALAAAGSLALGMALAPPPLVEGLGKRLLVGGQDLIYDLAALLPPPEVSAPGAEPADDAVNEAPVAGYAPVDGTAADEDGDAAASAARTAAPPEQREGPAAETAQAPRQYWMPPRRNLDKRVHLAGFALLGVLAVVSFLPLAPWRALPALALLALSIEVLQGFTVRREPSALDLAADLLGAVVGVVAAWIALGLVGRWRGLQASGL